MLKYLYFPSISIEWCCITLIAICLVITVIKRLTQKGVLSKRIGNASAVLVGYIVFLMVILLKRGKTAYVFLKERKEQPGACW